MNFLYHFNFSKNCRRRPNLIGFTIFFSLFLYVMCVDNSTLPHRSNQILLYFCRFSTLALTLNVGSIEMRCKVPLVATFFLLLSTKHWSKRLNFSFCLDKSALSIYFDQITSIAFTVCHSTLFVFCVCLCQY